MACDGYIKKFQNRELEAQPGFTVEETLEVCHWVGNSK